MGILSFVFSRSTSAKSDNGGNSKIDGNTKKNKQKSPEFVFEYKALIKLSKAKIFNDFGYNLVEANPAKNRVRVTFRESKTNSEIMFYIGLNSNEKRGVMKGQHVTLIESPELRFDDVKKQKFGSYILDIFDRYENSKISLAI